MKNILYRLFSAKTTRYNKYNADNPVLGFTFIHHVVMVVLFFVDENRFCHSK